MYSAVCIGGPRQGERVEFSQPLLSVPIRVEGRNFFNRNISPSKDWDIYTYEYTEIEILGVVVPVWLGEDFSSDPELLSSIDQKYFLVYASR